MQEWQNFESNTIEYCEGKDFPWTKPDMTLSQFIYHWRRNNIAIIPINGVTIKIDISRTVSKNEVLYYGVPKLRSLISKLKTYRDLHEMHRRFHMLGECEPKLKKWHKHIDRLKKTDDLVHMAFLHGQTNYSVGHHLVQHVKGEIETLQRELRVEKIGLEEDVYSTEYINNRPLNVESIYPWIINTVDKSHWYAEEHSQILYHNINVSFGTPRLGTIIPLVYEFPMSYKLTRKNFNNHMKSYLGPRILPYNCGEIIDDMSCLDIIMDPYERYICPLRDLVEDIEEPIWPNYKKKILIADSAIYGRNIISSVNPSHPDLKTKDRKRFAQNCRRALAKLSGQSLKRMLYLDTVEWFYETYSLDEYRLLGAVGLLPRCKTIEAYKYEHEGVRAHETIRLLEEQRQDDELPF